MNAKVYWLAIVMGVNAVVAAWYYLAVVKRMFFDDPSPEAVAPVEVPSLLRIAMAVAAVILVVGGIYPRIISEFAEKSFL
jgi:NADH:ubiquinone oxidoreductase subunit 2 (subunit N)